MDVKIIIIYFQTLCIAFVEVAMPGTFFWKPRIGLVFKVKGSSSTKPGEDSDKYEHLVLLEGYNICKSILIIMEGLSARKHPHLDPRRPHFYTNSYRWLLRHLDRLVNWLAYPGEHYITTHEVWENRYLYTDSFIPSWLRQPLALFINDEDWAKEEDEFRKFEKYVEPLYSKYYVYPNPNFDNFKSVRSSRKRSNKFDDSEFSFNKGR